MLSIWTSLRVCLLAQSSCKLYFDNVYVRKQPVAWKEYCAEYWLTEPKENMDMCTGRRHKTEMLLKTALNTIQLINHIS